MNWPNQTDEYRSARDALLQAEIELRRSEEAVAAQRRALPLGGEVTGDYVFDSLAGPVTFAELFASGKDTLYLYNFMFIEGEQGRSLEVACPDCTSIIDGVDGALRHLLDRIDVAIVAKAPIEQFAAWGADRGWRLMNWKVCGCSSPLRILLLVFSVRQFLPILLCKCECAKTFANENLFVQPVVPPPPLVYRYPLLVSSKHF